MLVQENKLQAEPMGFQLGLIQTANFISNKQSYYSKNSFSFLNLSHQFRGEIDWNCNAYGKLWTYNLCYFDFLLQEVISKEEGVALILDFRNKYSTIKDGLETYPSSLRVMNCVKFITKHRVRNKKIDQLIYSDLKRVSNNLEYHLLGNHLLENAFALLIGSIYFTNKHLFQKATRLLEKELEEQILPDGGHFELSPMYHQLILSRALDGINLVFNNEDISGDAISDFLKKKAKIMLSWLNNITFNAGEIPLLNDSAFGIAPTTKELVDYAKEMGVEPYPCYLGESGYRKFENEIAELLVDVGQIGATYIPGHVHCDLLSFVLYFQNQSYIVDPGVSTYEKNAKRQEERSTSYHNTVSVNNEEQSQIWGGFRVGKRATCFLLEDRVDFVSAKHNGYESLGAEHFRSFKIADQQIIIQDKIDKEIEAVTYLHFHPKVSVQIINNTVQTSFGTITFEGKIDKLYLLDYQYAQGFNSLVNAQKLSITFSKSLTTTISTL